MAFDDGILKIYSVGNIADAGKKPVIGLKEKSSHYFGFEAVGVTRYYAAMQVNSSISAIVHIWQDRGIEANDICILEDKLQYKCSFVQHVMNEENLPITKITLERLKEDYVIQKN